MSDRNYLEQIPPHSRELEQALIGGLMVDPAAIATVSSLLTVDSFYDPQFRKIYKAIYNLFSSSRPTDLNMVVNELASTNDIKAVGGIEGVGDIQFATPFNLDCEAYARQISDYSVRRQLIEAHRKGLISAYDTSTPIEKVCADSEALVYAATHGRSLTNNKPVRLSDLLSETFDDLEQRSQGNSLPGIACGFHDLDAMTQGFQRSDLIIVAARPAMGKTSFCLNIAQSIWVSHNLPIVIFSLEMAKEQLATRFLSTEARVPSGRLRAGQVAADEWEPIGCGINTLSQVPIYIDDSPDASVAEMRSKLRHIQSEEGGELGMVFVDYLQLMEGVEGENRAQALSKMTRALKIMARELNVPVVALSQLSRGVESRTNKRPMMSDLKDSGSIEQDADLVLMLYRDEYYNPDTPDRGIAEVIICKHRNGPVGTVKLLFDPHFTQFRNLARPQGNS